MHTWILSFVSVVHLIVAPTTPHWNRSYHPAVKLAETAHRPMAVVIGNGAEGWNAICANGTLEPAVAKLLAEHYVCLYVDAGDEDGKVVAAAFEADKLPTLVISDKTAKYQAFRQSGTMTNERLSQTLQRFAAYEVQSNIPSARTTYQPSTGYCQT
jgi:hypothetical protein